ncbi:VOC family protein [Spongiactinospora sp. TRM90649]|uniref:VOC family protein n=1 Tax=Spongiactinospora sp. TRM90649 TaxID=3031114 RepID=UPI0023F8909B|nr:VOC family protein [Spongiactinospora sp. TRM90649]MDF5757769.1 VOC family protein [Spongiactinospora sp. TRM90649]
MIDHLAYATPDLDATVADLEGRLGVHTAEGGAHPGFGTRNRLVGLGGRRYLEIIGPDPEQPAPRDGRWFGIDGLREPSLTTWAAPANDIDVQVEKARAEGYDPGDAIAMSRRSAVGGIRLEWRLTPPRAASVVPFLIEWGRTRHPGASGLPLVRLVSFAAGHPRPSEARDELAALGVDLDVFPSARPLLVAVVEGRHGPVRMATA